MPSAAAGTMSLTRNVHPRVGKEPAQSRDRRWRPAVTQPTGKVKLGYGRGPKPGHDTWHSAAMGAGRNHHASGGSPNHSPRNQR